MRYVFHEEKAELNGVTIRLLRCRNQTMRDDPQNPLLKVLSKVGPTHNELVASWYDSKKAKFRDLVRMMVADALPEAMPQFLLMSISEITRLLPKYKKVEKTAKKDCQIVRSFDAFAEALQKR